MDKREQIVNALAELSQTRGLYRVTMDELASRAGLSKRTIYRYFRSKDEVVEALMDRFMNAMAVKLEHIVNAHTGPAEILNGVARLAAQTANLYINPLVLDDLRCYYPWLWDKIDSFRSEKIQQNVDRLMLGGGPGKHLRQVNPGVFAAAFLASVRAVVNPNFILEQELTFEETVKELIGLFLYGIVDAGKAGEHNKTAF